MKATKKILAVLVCLCVVCSCAVFAVSAAEAKGSITIQNPSNSDATVAGKTFNVYKIFNATTSGTNTSYSWYEEEGVIPFYDFFYGANGVVEKNVQNGNVQNAVEYLSQFNSEGHNFELSQIAEDLHTYIGDDITPIKTVKADPKANLVNISDLSYGYYLVYDDTDLEGSAVRSAVMLTTVNKDAVITLKANRPQILKQVKENDGVTFGKGTSVNIGDTVSFKITTVIPAHTLYTTYQYYVEDTMHDGLALDVDSIKVLKEGVELNSGITVATTGLNDGVDFKVDFTELLKDDTKYDNGEELTIEYTAKVTDKIDNTNQNTAKLTYSNDPTNDNSTGSVSDSANVFSYQFVFTKFAEDTNGILTNIRLAGAKFKLYRVVEGQPDELITFNLRDAQHTDGDTVINYKQYIVAADNAGEKNELETMNEGSATITLGHLNMGGHLGDISIFGLSEGKYKLVETQAPNGYVLPATPFEIEIVDAIGELGSVATLNVTGSHEKDDAGSIVNTNGIAEGVLTVWAEITNKPGSALPETGGMGTTIFTVLGIVMMAGAAAFFTSRKRNSVA